MSETREHRLERVFHELTSLPAEEREARLRAETAGTSRRLRRLLEAHGRVTEGFLAGSAGPEDPSPDPLRCGALVGDCRLLERIGEGGMGTVYRARQLTPPREVAVKVVRAGRLSGPALRRFELEVEVLGSLEHPNVARIYAAGTTVHRDLDGTESEVPYLVMELVRGRPIVEYARERRLPRRQLLELFARVCDAIEYAHQRGVLHRDVKSENVLVTDEGTGAPAEGAWPKVLDFGIARPLSGRRGPEGELTWCETREGDILGSLSCLSPEQVGDAPAFDARADVYALGVLLYRLLAGRPPLELEGLSLPCALRRITEEEPPLLGRMDRSLAGDLERIAAKALAKDPSERYRSAFDLARDVRLHLAGQPIEARSHSRLYVLRRELRRHRHVVVGTLLVIGLLGAFGVHASWQARRNRALAESESAAKERAENALYRREIDRGRLLGRANNPHGEEILWRALFADPANEEALWALREYVLKHNALVARPPTGAPAVRAVASADGSRLYLARSDGRVELLDGGTLEPRASISFESQVTALALTEDERELAVGTADGRVFLHDLERASLRATLVGHQGAVRALVARGGSWYSASDDGTVRQWDRGSGRPAASGQARIGRLASLAVAEDGRVAAGGESDLALWEPGLGAAPRRLVGHRHPVAGLTFGASPSVLYSVSADRRIGSWDLAAGTHVLHLAFAGQLRRVWYDRERDELIIVGRWTTCRVDPATGTPLQSQPVLEPTCAAYAPGARRLIVGERDGSLRSWALEPSPLSRGWSGTSSPTSIALSTDGLRFVAGDGRQVVARGSTASLSEAYRAETGGGRIRVGFAPSGAYYGWTERDSSRLVVADARDDRVLLEIGEVSRNNPHAFAFHPTQDWVATVMRSGEVSCWRPGEAEPFLSLATEGGSARAVAFAPAGDVLWALDAESRTAEGFGLPDGRRRARFEVPNTRLWTLDVDPAGELLAASGMDGTVYVWELASGRPLEPLARHRGGVWEVRFLRGHPDLLGAISGDTALRIWNARTARELAEIEFAGRFSPANLDSSRDGRWLAVAGSADEVHFLDLHALERRLADQLEYALARFGGEVLQPEARRRLRAWAEGARARPAPAQ